MKDQPIVVEAHGAVLKVVFNRPEKLNAITPPMLEMMSEAVDRLSRSDDLRLLLITATGRFFSAGADLRENVAPDYKGSFMGARRHYRETGFHALFDAFETVEKPVVVAHQGPCLGGGLELSLSCDFRLAAESARYALPEIAMGLLPGSGGVSRLTRLVGPHWARWLVMAAQQIDAREALSMGLVHAVYEDAVFDQRVDDFCQKLATQPPETIAMAKLSIELAKDLDRAQGRTVERIANGTLFLGDEHRAMTAALLARLDKKPK